MEPRLVFTNDPPAAIVKTVAASSTLIIADEYNAPRLGVPEVVCVDDQVAERIEHVKHSISYDDVIAVGGCTALDFGRACAVGKFLTAIPTILSNSCLSTDRSVISRNGIYRSEKTTAPRETIVSMPAVLESHSERTNKWSGSGLADLFAAISAAIEFEWFKNEHSFVGVSFESCARDIPLCMEAFEWSRTLTGALDKRKLVNLAYYLHESSLDVVRNGHSSLNAGAEHVLYYQMQQRYKYPKDIATHGWIVSIGTMLTVRLFSDCTGESNLFERLQRIYRAVKVPMTYAELGSIGISREHIVRGMRDLADIDCLYSRLPLAELLSRLDSIYASE